MCSGSHGYFCQLDTNLRLPGKKEAQLRDCLYQTGPGGKIFLIDDGCGIQVSGPGLDRNGD